jgi:predicted  nucleic acid-binding Zn-ribbon protein
MTTIDTTKLPQDVAELKKRIAALESMVTQLASKHEALAETYAKHMTQFEAALAEIQKK